MDDSDSGSAQEESTGEESNKDARSDLEMRDDNAGDDKQLIDNELSNKMDEYVYSRLDQMLDDKKDSEISDDEDMLSWEEKDDFNFDRINSDIS